MKNRFLSVTTYALVALALLILSGCHTQEPLSLWKENAPAKTALSNYIRSVTDKGSPDFIPVENRIELNGILVNAALPGKKPEESE